MAGTRAASTEPPRSTAYYYADLERFKRKPDANPDELSEYVESNEIINDGPIREIPPFRDRQWSLPEYHTPEKRGETYSTAGTFPMPEPKEKEPLLAELEVVGRLPLTQLEVTGVRRSRSWYLCCPNVGEDEMSRESSWRYSSLRPVTAPPVPGQNGLSGILVATQSSRAEDITTIRAERDALARTLASERQRAATAARAHDARLAELHGVIAELVRRRAADKHARAIPEEEGSDECDSTRDDGTQLEPAADASRSSALSTLPQDKGARNEEESSPVNDATDQDTSLNLSERDSDVCLSTARCSQYDVNVNEEGSDSCQRLHGSDNRIYTASVGRCESREAKVASRVKLKRTEETDSNQHNDETWCTAAAEQLALDVCAQADLREALLAAHNDDPMYVMLSDMYDTPDSALSSRLSASRAQCSRLQADIAVLHCALARATDTAHRLQCACAVQESWCVSLCLSLRAADRALETYDVLLALAESKLPDDLHTAQLVARQLLTTLESESERHSPLLSPGPWLQHHHLQSSTEWSSVCEQRLRAHASRLKADTVRLRPDTAPALFSYHDIEESELPKSAGTFNMADMEAAVLMQEVLAAREAKATRDLQTDEHKNDSTKSRRRRHWLEPKASETDL